MMANGLTSQVCHVRQHHCMLPRELRWEEVAPPQKLDRHSRLARTSSWCPMESAFHNACHSIKHYTKLPITNYYENNEAAGTGTLPLMQHQWLRAWICNHVLKTTLVYLNRDNPVVIQTDASKYGLSVALLQDGCQISFAVKSLNDVKSRYTSTERQYLIVCYGMGEIPSIYLWETFHHTTWPLVPENNLASHPCHPTQTTKSVPSSEKVQWYNPNIGHARKWYCWLLSRFPVQIPISQREAAPHPHHCIDYVQLSDQCLTIIHGLILCSDVCCLSLLRI